MNNSIIGERSRKIIQLALEEDIGSGDVTTNSLVDPAVQAEAKIISRSPLTLCGQPVAEFVFSQVDNTLRYEALIPDGTTVPGETVVSRIQGSYSSILQGERLALNILQRLSGISTQTAKLVDAIKHTNAKILDTRKTTPGLRELERYAVRIGGGENHRFGLFDQVLIKNNHVDLFDGDVAKAIQLAKKHAPPGVKIEVEVRNLSELAQAAGEEPDIILLDNMSPREVRSAINYLKTLPIQKLPLLEASGNLREDTVKEYAETGVDRLSFGMLTHSVRAADLSLRFVSVEIDQSSSKTKISAPTGKER